MPGRLRVGSAWLFAGLFLVFSSPTTASLVVASGVACLGLALRAWAAGSVDKGARLAVVGPYAYTRNPLYLGSFVIGAGITLAGGHWAWPVLFAAYFAAVYVPTVRREADELAEQFGEGYREYAEAVPALRARLTPYRPDGDDRASERHPARFSWARYMRYREWEAALGVLALIGALALKLRLTG